MGELPVTSGDIRCSPNIAYVPQSPWVFSSSLKQNILFGLEFDSERYYRVLKACALDQVSTYYSSSCMVLYGAFGAAVAYSSFAFRGHVHVIVRVHCLGALLH